jgi:hypothetical protein
VAYRQDWINYIRRTAPKYGVDPQAVLAVASAEGLSGGVGDQGTSFGPFQLHRGGALPAGRDRAWAESPAGIDYALRQIAQVAKGQHGRQAVQSIVTGFERPADPTSEIGRATGALGQFGGGGLPAAQGPAPAPPGQQAPSAPGRNPYLGLALSMVQQPQQRLSSQPLPYTPSNGGLQAQEIPNASPGQDVLAQALQMLQARRQSRPQSTPGETPQGGTPASAPPAGIGSGVSGKIIGTPGAGTHTLGNWESDRAYDEALPVGTPIRAPFDGTIGSQFGALGSKSSRFSGLRMHVVGKQNEAYLAHLSKIAPGITPGSRVRRGQIIGYSGSANGVAHLHEGLRRGNPRTIVPLT